MAKKWKSLHPNAQVYVVCNTLVYICTIPNDLSQLILLLHFWFYLLYYLQYCSSTWKYDFTPSSYFYYMIPFVKKVQILDERTILFYKLNIVNYIKLLLYTQVKCPQSV